MPTYVDSNASGNNDGTSWTDAYTSIASTVGVAAGTEIWVSSAHSELKTANTAWSWSNGALTSPVKILSVDSSTDQLAAGAIFGTDPGSFYTLTISGNLHVYGCDIRSSYVFSLMAIGTNPVRQVFDNCQLRLTRSNGDTALNFGTGSLKSYRHVFRNCAFDQSAQGSWNKFRLSYNASIRMFSCTFTTPATVTQAFAHCNQQGVDLLVVDSDLSAFGTLIEPLTSVPWTATFRRCVLKSSWAAHSGSLDNPNQSILVESSKDGTISDPPLGLQQLSTYLGTVKSDLTRYRTGGASDGEQSNAYSWDMTSNSSGAEIFNPLESPPMIRWVDAGSQTVTVYVASGATLQDDEFWVEVSSPDEGGSPTSRGEFNSTRPEPLDTPANLTTDGTSTWNGTGVGTLQKIDVAINPAVAGPVIVRAYLAKASTTVYLDPKIEVA